MPLTNALPMHHNILGCALETEAKEVPENCFRMARNPFLHRALSHEYRLGPYEVRSRVGASGVGEVHGAKILFEKSVVQDPSR
jgi:hypothetical protein